MDFFIYGLIILVAGVLLITSCNPDAGVPPSLTFGTGTAYISADAQVDAGSNIKVLLHGSKGDADLQYVTIYQDGKTLDLERFPENIENNISSNPFTLTATPAQFSKELTFTAQSSGASEYLFVLTDLDGLKDSVSFMLTSNTSFNLFETSLKVYNADGPTEYYGSVDLQTGKSVPSTSTSGDVQDFGIGGSATGWAKKIQPENGTEMFLPPASTVFEDVNSLEGLVDALNQSTAVTESSVSVGDIFIFKSPTSTSGVYDYFIMKTLEVVDDGQVGVGHNQDYYVFSLKGRVN